MKKSGLFQAYFHLPILPPLLQCRFQTMPGRVFSHVSVVRRLGLVLCVGLISSIISIFRRNSHTSVVPVQAGLARHNTPLGWYFDRVRQPLQDVLMSPVEHCLPNIDNQKQKNIRAAVIAMEVADNW